MSTAPATTGLHDRRTATAVTAVLVLLMGVVSGTVTAQEERRVGDDPDPVVGAVQLSRAAHEDGAATHAVVGRHDVFADNLAATALAGVSGSVLYTTGGPAGELRPEVLQELGRALGDRACQPGDPPDVYLAGGTAAVSGGVQQALTDAGYCVVRLGGGDRIDTAIALAGAVDQASDTIILARDDEWADAAAVGSYAAATGTRILITPTERLDDRVAQALDDHAPQEILLMGGEAALSASVAEAAGEIAPVRRIDGPARDATAVAIAERVWSGAASGNFAIGHGYAGTAWSYLFAGAPLAGRMGLPVLYADDAGPTAATQQVLEEADPDFFIPLGPAVPPDDPPAQPPPPAADLAAADVRLEVVASLDRPLVLRPRPEVGELWVAERSGRVRAIGGGEVRTVLDISDTVSTSGERGLLGMDFSPDGRILYTSSSDTAGDSVLDAFDIVGDVVDAGSRRQLLTVDQPASNHNGGDLHIGPDGHLWWSLGDGGGADDTFGHGQRSDTLLATLVRIDPVGGQPYAIPPDNPFVGGGGAPEVWAFGLRNPFRFSFDPATDDLYIADVGQDRREEIDHVPAGTGAGANFGWSIFEGTQQFRPGQLADHHPPVWETTHADGNCSITGGVVYRGSAIPQLFGAYLYADLCNAELRAILVQDGQVTQDADLGVDLGSPVGFGVDHQGEVYALSLGGEVFKFVPA